MTSLKLKSPVPFPASVVGAGGISVSKSNGEWTIEPDFSTISTITASNLGDPSAKQVWIFDPVTLDYNVLTLAGLGDALYSATSTTSLAIATGSKTFTTQSGKDLPVGSWVFAYSNADPTNFMLGQVTAYSTTSLTINVTTIGGTGTKTDWNLRASSAPGAAGKSAGHSYLWNTATSGDPGSGKLLGNNATISSITAINISETDHDGNSIASNIATWDDSTSTIHGRLKIYDPVTPTNYAYFDITGTNVDAGTYDTLTVSYVGSGGTLSNALAVAVMFIPKGDKGDKGDTGSMTGPVSSVDGEVALFNGTSGSVVKRASQTGIAKLTSGVLSAATAGTDYYNPGGTDVAVADGGTGASTAAGALTNLTARGQGKETIFIPAAAMVARTTNGPASGTVEMSTNKIMVRSLDFDTTTQQFAQFSVWFPKSWNLGTVTFQPTFSQATTAAGGVVFGLAGVAVSDGDALDAALGTAQTSVKTAGTANIEYQGPESSAITIAGTPAAGDRVIFQVNRTVADASDTLAQNARLHGIRLFFTTNAATDA